MQSDQRSSRRWSAHERYEKIRPALEGTASLSSLAREHRIPLRTLQRWKQHFEASGLEALANRKRKDKGKQQTSELLQHFIEGLALQTPPLSTAMIHRMVRELAENRKLGKCPSYSTVYRLIREMDPGLRCLAQEGSKAYANRFELVLRREATRPNMVWQADHTLLDIYLLDERDQINRPWLSIIIDDHSRAICGYYLFFGAPSALHTALALRQAIWRKEDLRWPVCGVPEVLYTDHGSDFTSDHIWQVCLDLKIQLTHSLPGQPRGRGRVERFFHTVNQMLLQRLPGYVPAGPPKEEQLLKITEFERRLHHFLIKEYHQRLHGTFRKTPLARWQEQGFLPRMPDSLKQLDLLLLQVHKARKVHRDGIHFQGLVYLSPQLAPLVGKPVSIRYDPRDLRQLRVFYEDQFCCEATCLELDGEKVSLKEVIQARRRHKRELRKKIKSRKSLVDAILMVKAFNKPLAPPKDKTQKPILKHSLKLYKSDE